MYARITILIRNFKKCNEEIKKCSFKHYYTGLYCISAWSTFKGRSYEKYLELSWAYVQLWLRAPSMVGWAWTSPKIPWLSLDSAKNHQTWPVCPSKLGPKQPWPCSSLSLWFWMQRWAHIYTCVLPHTMRRVKFNQVQICHHHILGNPLHFSTLTI